MVLTWKTYVYDVTDVHNHCLTDHGHRTKPLSFYGRGENRGWSEPRCSDRRYPVDHAVDGMPETTFL